MALPIWFTSILLVLMTVTIALVLVVIVVMIQEWLGRPPIEPRTGKGCDTCGEQAEKTINGVAVCSSCRRDLFW